MKYAVLGLALVVGGSLAAAQSPNAKTANNDGMKHYRAKRWADAAASFRAAIAIDPSYVVAHYNLACVAALQKDTKTAIAELEWLAGSDDPLAAQKLTKAGRDPDLRSLDGNLAAQAILRWGSVMGGYQPAVEESEATTAETTKLGEIGRHDTSCETIFTVVRAIHGDVLPKREGDETVLVSLADGIVLLDGNGAVIARSEELAESCTGSEAGLRAVSAGQVVSDDDLEIVVHATFGGRADFYDEVSVWKVVGAKLIKVFAGRLSRYARVGKKEVEQNGLVTLGKDELRVREPGQKAPETLRWDPMALSFTVAAKAAPAAVSPPAAP